MTIETQVSWSKSKRYWIALLFGRWQYELMIDCGLVQERKLLARNWDPCPIPADEINALVVTHAHVDHIGLIPRFVAEGFRGPIYATHPTVALVELMLKDSAKIQFEDAKYNEDVYLMDGRLPISEVNDALGLNLPSTEFHTIGGMLFARLHHLAKKGDSIVEHGYRFTVEEATDRVVEKVRAEREGFG